MNDQEAKERVRATFDAVADVYDCHALRFFHKAAECLPATFAFTGNESVLDVAAGTGIPARAMAAYLPHGRVTAVDLSEGMLAQASAKCRSAGITNINFLPMDMTAMSFEEASFDAANCSFGIFFVEEMIDALRHIASKVRSGGAVVTTHFRSGSFGQLTELLGDRVEAYGLDRPPLGWMRVATEAQNIDLFESAGLTDIEITPHDLGYFLDGPEQWWEVVWNAGYRSLIASLEPARLEQFKREHLEEVAELMTPEGLRLDIEVLITKGVRP